MTVKCSSNLIEVDESVPLRAGSKPGTVIVRVKEGENWQGNEFTNCDLEIPEQLLVESAKPA